MPAAPIRVVCDCCRAEGLAGEDPFAAFGALLDFDPVPRLKKRADGWDSETQRAFIAALSLTGSVRAACRAVGKSAFGVEQLLRSEGSEGFRAAYDEAMAIAGDERSRRLAEGLRAVAAEQSGWHPPDPPWAKADSRRSPGRPPASAAPPLSPPEPDERALEAADKLKMELIEVLLRKYVNKLWTERRARLEGRIAEADFTLRQITCFEIAMDVVSGDGMKLLKEARFGRHDLLAIAETTMSKLLDEARREHWEKCGDPPRPAPPVHLFVKREGYSTEPPEGPPSGEKLDWNERCRREEAAYATEAQAQIEWEAQARRDYEERRERDASS